jgi:hypothetical protein
LTDWLLRASSAPDLHGKLFCRDFERFAALSATDASRRLQFHFGLRLMVLLLQSEITEFEWAVRDAISLEKLEVLADLNLPDDRETTVVETSMQILDIIGLDSASTNEKSE